MDFFQKWICESSFIVKPTKFIYGHLKFCPEFQTLYATKALNFFRFGGDDPSPPRTAASQGIKPKYSQILPSFPVFCFWNVAPGLREVPP